MTKKTPPVEAEPEDYLAFLVRLSEGKTVPELGQSLQRLIQQVLATGKPGSLTHSISFKPVKGTTGQVYVEDTIKVKLPEHVRPAAVYFATPNGRISRSDPNQDSLFDVVIEPVRPGVVIVDGVTGEIIQDNTTTPERD